CCNISSPSDTHNLSLHDALPISRRQFLFLKTFDRADKGVKLYPPSLGVQSERQTGQVEDAFDSLRIDLAFDAGTPLETPATIVADRKSTRLNSSHQIISYAVFCL